MNKLKQWMQLATTEQKTALVEAAGTSVQYAYQLSNGVRTASADLGGSIERQTRKMSKAGLPVVTRADLVPACAACEYFKACKGKVK